MDKIKRIREICESMQGAFRLENDLKNIGDELYSIKANVLAIKLKILMGDEVKDILWKLDEDKVHEIASKFFSIRFPEQLYDSEVKGSYAWEWKLRFEGRNPTLNMDYVGLGILFDILDDYKTA